MTTTIQISVEIFPISEKLPEANKNVLVYCRGAVTYREGETFECWIGFWNGKEWKVQDDRCDAWAGESYTTLPPVTEDYRIAKTRSGKQYRNVSDYDSAVAWAEIPLIPNYNLFKK